MFACIFYHMLGTWRNAYCFTGPDREYPVIERHNSAAGEQVVQFFTLPVAMEPGLTVWANGCLGKALIPVAMDIRVH